MTDFPLWARVGAGAAVAATLAYVATPVAIRTAHRYAFYDVPFGYKGHRTPTPYLGGAAVMAAFALAVLIGAGHPSSTLPLLGGAAILLVVGTIDDRRTVSPSLRVAVEFAAGASLATAGLGWKLGAGGLVDAAITGVWVVAVVNAFNLFDNMDGAASTMALVVGGGACVLAVVTGHTWAAAGSAALCGACLGFLPHNLASPARIFLGDGGSMPLGFVAAALVASAAHGAEPSTLGLLVGFLLVGIPVLDTCLVIVSRKRRGMSILKGGQDHLTHRTRVRMRTARRVALVLGATQALISALVIVATRSSSAALVYVVLAFTVCAAVAIIALDDPTVRNFGPSAVSTAPSAASRAPTKEARSVATWWRHLALAGLVVLGFGAGISALFEGFYNSGVYLPVGLALVVVAAAAAIARPPQITLPVGLALAGFGGLGLWSLLSVNWAHAVEQATVQSNLWLTYGACLLLMAVFVRRRRDAATLLIAVGVGIAVVGISVLVRMLGSNPGSLFLDGRLNSPLGYVNGEACVFAMGCWLSLAVAERREPLLAGLGSATTVAFACLTLLSQSRGAAIAMLGALVVTLAAVPGTRRRLLAVALVGGGVALAAGPLLDVYSAGRSGVPEASVVHSAAGAIVLASIVAGAVWSALVALEQTLSGRSGESAYLARATATAAAVAVVALPAVVGLARLRSIEHTARTQWHAFVHLSDTGSGSAPGSQARLFSGAGNRYDYWRIAGHVFARHPIIGVGAGNYPESYFRKRHTQEPIQNPHSIEFQVLSELGLVGGGLLALLVGGAVVGVVRLRRAAVSPLSGARTLMVAATGATVVWLVDTSGDWIHLLPGATAIGLAAVAVLCRGWQLEDGEGAVSSPEGSAFAGAAARARALPMLVGAAVVAISLAIAGASLLRGELTQVYLQSARSELARNPGASISDANRALRLDSANLDAYYVKAAALARFNRGASAQNALLTAAQHDPGAFVTWVLLGDLEVRMQDFTAAKAYYSRALTLDPNDAALAAMAANPALQLRGGGR